MTPRKRVPYFNVPASQQPLRVRARDVRGTPRPPERDNPLEQLVVGNLFHPLDDSMSLHDIDVVEALDAAHEDANGRLPHEAGYLDPWTAVADVMPVDPGELEPAADTFALQEGTPDMDTGEAEIVATPVAAGDPGSDSAPSGEGGKEEQIPDWVLADARELAASGMTLRRIAKAVLPATGCPDVPTCAELLDRLLTERDAPSADAGAPAGKGSRPESR